MVQKQSIKKYFVIGMTMTANAIIRAAVIYSQRILPYMQNILMNHYPQKLRQKVIITLTAGMIQAKQTALAFRQVINILKTLI